MRDLKAPGRAALACLAAAIIVWMSSMGPSQVAGQNQVARPTTGKGDPLEQRYVGEVLPLLAKYCAKCHSQDLVEAELDFGDFPTLASLRPRQKVWTRVRDVLETGDMPPPEGKQPTEAERRLLKQWVREFLEREALADAGDPGPVGLRRLDNSEYTYAIRDLTGVPELDPTREFPVDGAAGEGFTNVASGQGMSPAMVRKYLDAAKETAAHLVFLPDGVRFSKAETRRDQTDELLDRIRQFYAKYTAEGGGEKFNLQGVQFESNQGGLLSVERVLSALLIEREALRSQKKSLDVVARERGLSSRYLALVWQALEEARQPEWSPLGRLQARWRTLRAESAAEDVGRLAMEIKAWQSKLWKFSPVGQVGREGGPKRWMEPIEPLVTRQELKVKLPAVECGLENPPQVRLTLVADGLGDSEGVGQEAAVFRELRIEYPAPNQTPAHPPVLLRDLPALVSATRQMLDRELPRSAEYLSALREYRLGEQALEEIARKRTLDPKLLERWADLVGFGATSRRIDGLLTQKATAVAGYASINGWSGSNALGLMTNNAKEPVTISTLIVPARGVTVHPSPEQAACIYWKSPIAGRLQVSGLVADADNKCGNGTSWRVEHRALRGAARLAGGDLDNGGRAKFQADGEITVAVDDLIALIVDPRQRDHVCDTTQVELTLTEVGGDRKWTLSREIVDRVLDGNPLADLAGNAAVWHFCATVPATTASPELPPMSTLARWKDAVLNGLDEQSVGELAGKTAETLRAPEPESIPETDRALWKMVRDWRGPLRWMEVARERAAELAPADIEPMVRETGVDPAAFGISPEGLQVALSAKTLILRGGTQLGMMLPADLAEGGELVATVEPLAANNDASLQVRVDSQFDVVGLSELLPNKNWLDAEQPILVASEGDASKRWRTGLREFGDLFPPAVCYTKIVPVDEVVTLTLYHREDDHLQRLMLTKEESAALNRLWDELLFVSHEPVELEVALEQLIQFATQDRQDLVSPFQAMQPAIAARARDFEKRLVAAEPAQLQSVIGWASRAWRRPVSVDETASLTRLYQELRGAKVDHESAVRLVLARILTSPDFLFKIDQAPAGIAPAKVSSEEMAARLSFFLWSSLPDTELISAAESGQLLKDADLVQQMRRMLHDDRVRRLAVHFACQWMHVRDFATNNDKNETLFPEFAVLRGDMFEETVLFCDDLIRNNRSILSLLDADHTFVNERLAKHYGLSFPPQPTNAAQDSVRVERAGWQRVEGMRGAGRGGVLGMATILASQSGASRTSPILRGNWVFETLLGDKLPKPPPGVPQLPEAVPAGLNERQMIEQHSSVAACARCHIKIDGFGFAMEGFDPIGRARVQPGDLSGQLADGTRLTGLSGLKQYLGTARRDEFVRHFCKKLLGYALGREVRLSDEPLLRDMTKRLAGNEYRFQEAVEAIVLSPQFRMIRGADRVDPE